MNSCHLKRPKPWEPVCDSPEIFYLIIAVTFETQNYEKYYKLPDFTCPSSCAYWQGQQLLQPPSQEISSVQQKTTTSSASNNLNTIIQKAGAAIGKFLAPFVG
jgi:hypothetical protein